jgi:ATP adenylyltransferase
MGELRSGTLSGLVARAVAHGKATGALVPLTTDLKVVHEGSLRFPVRVLGNVNLKLADPTTSAPAGENNPFLPHDPNLFVAELTESHICLLNKYPIIEGHLLIVTRAFEAQETLLTLEDFEATWRCLVDVEGVAFYNSGQMAGASQPHKHMQLIPHPTDEEALPMAALLKGELLFRGVRHVYAQSQRDFDGDFVRDLHGRYGGLLAQLGLSPTAGELKPKPYNLLLTREFMMVVPRIKECVGEMSLNAMAFMGSLFVRSQEQLEALQRFGLLNTLRYAAGDPEDKEA